MKDEDKTKEQLINEMLEMRQHIAELEAADAERKRAEEALGETRDYLENLLIPDDRREEAMAHIHRTVAGERWEAVEIPILGADGKVRIVLWNSATLYAKDGTTVIATIAQGQDITERKRAEKALQKAHDELESQIGGGSLFCDIGQRYSWLRQAYSREKIRSTEVFQVDPSTLHGTGALVRPSGFDIEVLHQGDACEERLTLVRL